jgi:hypothetical protein
MMQGFSDPVQTAIRGWLDSPGHREAMLNTQFSQSAVGIYEAPDGTIYVTQLFRRPSPIPLPLREVPGREAAPDPQSGAGEQNPASGGR